MKENGPNGYSSVIRQELMAAVGLVLKKVGTGYEGRGWPDLYVPSPIWHGWIELKVEGREVSDAQQRKMRLLLERQVPAVVLRWTASEGERIERWNGELLARRVVSESKAVRGRDLLVQLAGICENWW